MSTIKVDVVRIINVTYNLAVALESVDAMMSKPHTAFVLYAQDIDIVNDALAAIMDFNHMCSALGVEPKREVCYSYWSYEGVDITPIPRGTYQMPSDTLEGFIDLLEYLRGDKSEAYEGCA